MLGTSTKELTLVRSPPVLPIRDVYPGFECFPSRIPIFSHPGSRIHIKYLGILIQKIGFYALGNMTRVVHHGSGSCFFTLPESRIQRSKRHRIRIRNSAVHFPKTQRIKVDLLCCVDAMRVSIHSAGHCLAAQGGALGLCLDKYNWLAHKKMVAHKYIGSSQIHW